MHTIDMFGFQYETSEGLRLDGMSHVLDLCEGDGAGHRSVPHTCPGVVAPPRLHFGNLAAIPVEPADPKPYDPVGVRVSAVVTNVSPDRIPILSVPQLLCLDTREVFFCAAAVDHIEPWECEVVWYEVIARDRFSNWMLVQMTDLDRADPPGFVGLDDLGQMVVEALGRAFAYREESLCAVIDLTGSPEDRRARRDSLDRSCWVTPRGDRFHFDRHCPPGPSPVRMPIAEAYRQGYRPCSLCGTLDWWRDGAYAFDHSDKVYWILTFDGRRLFAWVTPELVNRAGEAEVYEPGLAYETCWLMRVRHATLGDGFVQSFTGPTMRCVFVASAKDKGRGDGQRWASFEYPEVMGTGELVVLESRMP